MRSLGLWLYVLCVGMETQSWNIVNNIVFVTHHFPAIILRDRPHSYPKPFLLSREYPRCLAFSHCGKTSYGALHVWKCLFQNLVVKFIAGPKKYPNSNECLIIALVCSRMRHPRKWRSLPLFLTTSYLLSFALDWPSNGGEVSGCCMCFIRHLVGSGWAGWPKIPHMQAIMIIVMWSESIENGRRNDHYAKSKGWSVVQWPLLLE